MNKKIINGLEYLEQNYRPSDIQKLLDNSKTKRSVSRIKSIRVLLKQVYKTL